MEESSGAYIDRLTAEIQEKRSFIDPEVIGILVDSISEYRKTFEALLTTLINSGLLIKDIYSGSMSATELRIPSSEPIHGKRRRDEISIRLADYLKQLFYLEDYFEFSLESLTPERVKNLRCLFGYINWSSMSHNSVSPNERIMADIENTLAASEDKLHRRVFSDGKKQLEELTGKIYCGLDDLSVYLREEYKLEVRERVIPLAGIPPELFTNQADEAVLLLKKVFKVEMGGSPFYTSFIKEILREDFSEKSDILKATVLTALRTHRSKVKEEIFEFHDRSEADKNLLIEGIRRLSGAGPALINIAEKLRLNADIVEERKLTLFQRLRFFFRKKDYLDDRQRIYTIIMFNPAEEPPNSLKLNFNKYISDLTAEGRLLLGYSNQDGSSFLDIKKLSNEELEAELIKHIKILYGCMKKLPAIDLYLRDRATNAMRGTMKGIKLDLNDIQSSIIKSNNRRLDYKARPSAGF